MSKHHQTLSVHKSLAHNVTKRLNRWLLHFLPNCRLKAIINGCSTLRPRNVTIPFCNRFIKYQSMFPEVKERPKPPPSKGPLKHLESIGDAAFTVVGSRGSKTAVDYLAERLSQQLLERREADDERPSLLLPPDDDILGADDVSVLRKKVKDGSSSDETSSDESSSEDSSSDESSSEDSSDDSNESVDDREDKEGRLKRPKRKKAKKKNGKKKRKQKGDGDEDDDSDDDRRHHHEDDDSDFFDDDSVNLERQSVDSKTGLPRRGKSERMRGLFLVFNCRSLSHYSPFHLSSFSQVVVESALLRAFFSATVFSVNKFHFKISACSIVASKFDKYG